MELARIELATIAMRRRRSTTELQPRPYDTKQIVHMEIDLARSADIQGQFFEFFCESLINLKRPNQTIRQLGGTRTSTFIIAYNQRKYIIICVTIDDHRLIAISHRTLMRSGA